MSKPIVIRDAVWGDVDLTPLEVEVLGAAELQRLRAIRQLGTASLVYPSANHTRFEHVLGTAHAAGRILDALPQAVDPRLRAGIRLAALVHDVGHVPYGHTFEDERRIFPRHDGPARTRHFLGLGPAGETELGAILARHGFRTFVLDALGAGDGAEAPQVVRDVVSGTVCADLLDYLRRDAAFTGIRRGYDERLFRYFALREGRLILRLSKGGLLREDAFSEVLHLLRLRYTLSERVYFHHAKVASGALVSKLVERAVTAGLQLPELFALGDEGLLLHLERRYAPADPVLARLLDEFRSRRLPKRAYVLTRRQPPDLRAELVRRFHADRAERERVEAELEGELGLEPGSVILYCPAAGMALKEADILCEHGPDAVVSLKDLQLSEVDELRAKHRNLWKLSVLIAARHVERRAELAARCAERFGAESELALPASGAPRHGGSC